MRGSKVFPKDVDGENSAIVHAGDTVVIVSRSIKSVAR